MATNKIVLSSNVFEIIREVELLGLGDLDQAKEIFDLYVEKGVLLESTFEDDYWSLFDQYSKVNLNFVMNELVFRKSYVFSEVRITDFYLYLKMFTVGLLGNNVLLTIQSFIRELKEIISTFDGKRIKTKLKLREASIIKGFVEMLDLTYTSEYNHLLKELDTFVIMQDNSGKSNKRALSTFQSYFKFTDILNDFWESSLTKVERIFYFPIYLWWNITAILPLRPREFLLIPRDCFRDSKNKNVVTFRKTTLKGSGGKVNYSIDEDYELFYCDVGESLASQIRKYIKLTDDIEANSINTLFRTEYHYNYFGKRKRYDSRLFSYANMRYCLRRFFSEIIQGRYDIKIINKKKIDLNPDSYELYALGYDEIEFINIGDTRHISSINAVASGATPTTVMYLASHSNIDISSHYFSNISTLLECKTYQAYKKSVDTIKTNHEMNSNFPTVVSMNEYVDLDNGARCYSPCFKSGKYDDCFKTVGKNGEIGECSNCEYYRESDYIIFVNDKKIFTKRLADDCDYLAKQINLVRQGKGYEEDVKHALLKLQNSTHLYEKYFYTRLRNRDK